MKNIDRLKQMNADQLAQVLVFDKEDTERPSCTVCAYSNNCNDDCFEGVKKWLGQKAFNKEVVK